MKLDIGQKIKEVKDKLEEVRKEHLENEVWRRQPKWFQLIREFYFEGELDRLETIRDRKFKVSIKLDVYCDTFGSKEFPIAEFDLKDDNTVRCAMLSVRS